MPRRIDIELTSRRDDGTWTWRAPGAKQPRGEVDGSLLPDGAKVGDVLRADAEFDVEGIAVTSVLTPKAEGRASGPQRIEVLGSGRSEPGGVSVTLAPGSRRRHDDDERPRRSRRPDGGPERSRGDRPRPARAGEQRQRGEGEGRGEHRDDRRPARPARTARTGERPGARPGERRDERPDRPDRPDRRREAPGGAERGARPRRGVQPAATFRNAALGGLRPEQLPVAEQLLRGGIPAVRQAIEEQNTRATAEGRPPVSPEPLLAMAEELLPKMNLASWMDRATAVRTAGKEAPLREVRSVVAGASAVALDDEGRTLLSALRESLETRVTALRDAWLGRITAALDEGRVADALRVASQAPEPAARIPAELAVRLATSAGEAMSPELSDADWLALLEVVVASPVRRTVKPAGLPKDPGEELLQTARRTAGQVPELARLLGLPIPPPPGPRRPSAVGARRG